MANTENRNRLSAGRTLLSVGAMRATEERTVVVTARPTDVRRTLAPLRRGGHDRCTAVAPGVFWRATNTPAGPATTLFMFDAGAVHEVRVRAWGPGSTWALEHAATLLGGDDDDRDFSPTNLVVQRARHRLPGLRLCRSLAVMEALVPSIIEQKVTGLEAHRSYAALVRAVGSPAPGPEAVTRLRLMVPPTAERLAETPTWTYHRCGLERKRADTIRTATGVAAQIESTTALPPAAGRQALESLPGIGLWTSAEVAQVAWGDPDAVSVGDYHLPSIVTYALSGETGGDDRRMLQLLEPFAGHRGRVARWLVGTTPRAARRAPRAQVRSIAGI